jgi:hypothetical protein
MVLLQVSELLEGDRFPDLTAAALGTWVRLKAMTEITGEPISARQIDRHGFESSALDELDAAGLLTETDGRFEATGMPEPERWPSATPEAVRKRVAAHRERQRATLPHTPSRQLSSNQYQIRSNDSNDVTTGNDVTGRDTREDAAPGPHQAEINGVLVRWTNA